MREERLKQLRQMADEEYKAFNCKLIPGINKERTLGVRVPALRKLAKEIVKGGWERYLEELETANWLPAVSAERNSSTKRSCCRG